MLSEKSIKEIEDATGITGLRDIIASQEAVDITPKKTKHFTEETYNVLYDNLTKQGLTPEKYEEAKAAGEEMSVKSLKRKLGYEFEGKTVEALHEYLSKQIKQSAETDVTKATSELKKDIEKLQEKIAQKETEISTLKNQFENDTINNEINSRFNSLQIEVPSHIKDEKEIEKYLKLEREKGILHFKSQYEFKKDEQKRIIAMQNGQLIKDELANAKTIDKLMDEYISASYLSLKKVTPGRGEGDKLPGFALNGIKSIDDLVKYADSKGIKKGTEAFDALHQEMIKKNS